MAVTFTGSTYYSTTSVPGGLSQNSAAFTVSLWMYQTSLGGSVLTTDTSSSGSIVVTGAAAGSTYPDYIGPSVYLLDFTLYFEQSVGNYSQDNYVAGPTMSLNTWLHVAMTFNGTTITGYVNGAQVASGGTPTATAIAWERVLIGGFNGDAQDAMLFNRALSATEVASLYRSRMPTVSRTGLVGHWPLLGGGNSHLDISGNGRHLTATGSLTEASRSAPSSWGGSPFAVLRSASAPITVGPKYLRLISGARTEALSVVTSGGAGSAGEIPALNASGLLDATFLPRVTVSAGAADAGKVVALNASGVLDSTIVNSTVTSSGAGDAGKLIALNSSGLIDSSAFAATAPTITATAAAALSAGNLVWLDPASGQVRPADNSLGRKAEGFVLTSYGSGATATVRTAGRLTGLSGLTPGNAYYLATAGGITDTAPTTAGLTWQYVGVAVSATELNFSPSFSVLL